MSSEPSQSMSPPVLPRVAAGEPSAVAECMERYGGLVWSIALRLTGSRADAEDAIQEIFIDLWKSAARFDESVASEKAFIAMIARRRLIDRRRRDQRGLQTEPMPQDPNIAGDAGDRRIESCAEVSLARRALRKLDPKERDVLLLSAYEGFSHQQIADRTGMPLGTVKTYIRRGLQRVRKALEGDRLGSVEGASS